MTLLQYIVAGICITGFSGLFSLSWRHSSKVSTQIANLDTKNAELFAESDRKTTRVESILTGPDGTNGVRGNVTQIIADVKRLQIEQTAQAQIDAVWKMGIEMRVALLEKKV